VFNKRVHLLVKRILTLFLIKISKFGPNTEIALRLPSAPFSNRTNSEHFAVFNTKTFRRSVFSGRKSTQCLLTHREIKCCSFNKCNPQTLFYFRFQMYNRLYPQLKFLYPPFMCHFRRLTCLPTLR